MLDTIMEEPVMIPRINHEEIEHSPLISCDRLHTDHDNLIGLLMTCLVTEMLAASVCETFKWRGVRKSVEVVMLTACACDRHCSFECRLPLMSPFCLPVRLKLVALYLFSQASRSIFVQSRGVDFGEVYRLFVVLDYDSF